jgi:chromosomal replication initiator protein
MTSPDRPQELVTPRQLAMYIAVNFTSMSVKAIAKKFEKSHATVLHGNTRIKNRIDVEPKLRDSLNEILESLGLTMGDINQ